MTLLITTFAGVICTALWYKDEQREKMRLGTLCLIYWGASLMWLCDSVFEFYEYGERFFSPSPEKMLNDSFLGLSVVALGLVIWIIGLLISDPKGVITKKILKDNK